MRASLGDFETRCKIDLSRGVHKYVEHPSCLGLFFSFSYTDDEKIYTWDYRKPWLPKKLFKYIRGGGIFEAHNVEFELNVWNVVFKRQFEKLFPGCSFPLLKIPQLRCSEAMAAQMTLPRGLEKLAIVLETKTQKDMTGKRFMLACARPRTPSKNNPSIWNEKPEALDRTRSYNRDDVAVEKQCGQKLVPLSPNELAIFHHTLTINQRGHAVDLEACKKAIEFSQRFEKEQKEKLYTLTAGRINSAKQYAALKVYFHSIGLKIPNVKAETLELCLQGKLTDRQREVVEVVLSIGKGAIGKYKAFVESAGKDGRIRGYLRYHAATTGRDGGKNTNPLNLYKSKSREDENIISALKHGDYEFFKFLYPDVFGALADCIRGMIIAAPGKQFFNADYSSIEARIIQYLAGDTEALEDHRKGIDTYIKLAARVLRKRPEQITKDERDNIGKPGELGCGFGMGWKKLQATCAQKGNPISDRLAKSIVQTYREVHHKVKTFWYDLEAAAIFAVKNPGKKVKISCLVWECKGDFLTCQFPNGKKLYYHEPKVKTTLTRFGVKDELSYTQHKGKSSFKVRTYGGKLGENVTQGLARELMQWAALRIEPRFPLVLKVYDELLSEVDAGADYKAFLDALNQIPPWLPGLPIKIGGWIGPRYKKS